MGWPRGCRWLSEWLQVGLWGCMLGYMSGSAYRAGRLAMASCSCLHKSEKSSARYPYTVVEVSGSYLRWWAMVSG